MHKVLLYNSEFRINRYIECHMLLAGVNEFLADKPLTECNSGTIQKLPIWS